MLLEMLLALHFMSLPLPFVIDHFPLGKLRLATLQDRTSPNNTAPPSFPTSKEKIKKKKKIEKRINSWKYAETIKDWHCTIGSFLHYETGSYMATYNGVKKTVSSVLHSSLNDYYLFALSLVCKNLWIFA